MTADVGAYYPSQRERAAGYVVQGLSPDRVLWPTDGVTSSNRWHDHRAIEANRGHAYTAVNALAKRISALRFRVVAVDDREGGEETEVFAHPLLDLLRRPNRWTSGRRELHRLTQGAMFCGRWYWLLLRDPLGVPRGYWPLVPWLVEPVRGRTADDYIASYVYRPNGPGTQGIPIPPTEIVPFVMPSLEDDLLGAAPARSGARSINASTSIQAYQERFFENNGLVSQVISTDIDSTRDDAQDLLDAAEARDRRHHRGLRDWGRSYFLPNGWSASAIQHNFRDMQFPDLDNRAMERVFETFGYLKGLAGYTAEYNRANIDGIQTIYAIETVVPFAEFVADVLTCTLAETHYPMPEGVRLEVRPPLDMVPRDKEFDLRRQVAYVSAGVLAPNEVREEEGFERVDGGDSPLVSAGLVPLSMSGEEPRPTAAESDTPPKPPAPEPEDDVEDPEDDDAGRVAPIACQRVRDGATPEGRARLWRRVAPHLAQAERGILRGARRFFREQESSIRDALLVRLKQLAARVDGRPDRVRANRVRGWMSRDEGDFILGEVWDAEDQARLFSRYVGPFVREALKGGGEYGASFVSLDFDVTRPESRVWLADHLSKVAGDVNDTTRKAITESVADGITAGDTIEALTKRVESVFADADRYRAATIARTESTTAFNAGSMIAWHDESLGGMVERKTWVASRDDRVRDSHEARDGETVALDAKFSGGMSHPGDPAGGPAEICNCRCAVVPVFKGES